MWWPIVRFLFLSRSRPDLTRPTCPPQIRRILFEWIVKMLIYIFDRGLQFNALLKTGLRWRQHAGTIEYCVNIDVFSRRSLAFRFKILDRPSLASWNSVKPASYQRSLLSFNLFLPGPLVHVLFFFLPGLLGLLLPGKRCWCDWYVSFDVFSTSQFLLHSPSHEPDRCKCKI